MYVCECLSVNVYNLCHLHLMTKTTEYFLKKLKKKNIQLPPRIDNYYKHISFYTIVDTHTPISFKSSGGADKFKTKIDWVEWQEQEGSFHLNI